MTFDDHKSAKKAKEKGALINPKFPPIGLIHYLKKSRKSSEKITSPQQQEQQALPVIDDVDSELRAMQEAARGTDFGECGTSDFLTILPLILICFLIF